MKIHVVLNFIISNLSFVVVVVVVVIVVLSVVL